MPANKSAALRYQIIDKCLSNKYKRFPTIDDLIEECSYQLGKVSKSTIEKDLQAMKNDDVLGYRAPIAFDKKNKGYYYEDPNYSIRALPLNDDELEAIKVAAQTLYQFRNTPFFSEFYSAIDKIFSKVDIYNRVDQKQETKYIQFEYEPVAMDEGNLPMLLQAVTECHPISFDYHKFDGKISRTENLQPLILKEYRNRWYLAGFNPKTKGILVYGIERMRSIEVHTTTFERPQNFDADHYFKNSLGITVKNNEVPLEIVLSFHPSQAEYIKTKPFHPSQKILKDKSDEFRISLFLQHTIELEMLILSYGELIKVVKPKTLAEAIGERLRNAISR